MVAPTACSIAREPWKGGSDWYRPENRWVLLFGQDDERQSICTAYNRSCLTNTGSFRAISR